MTRVVDRGIRTFLCSPMVLALGLALGCSDDGIDPGGGDGGTGGPPLPVVPPDPDGTTCSENPGWLVDCDANFSQIEYQDPATGSIETWVDPIMAYFQPPFSHACCEGKAALACSAVCQSNCTHRVCVIASDQHRSIAEDLGVVCQDETCGFDLDECKTQTLHTQTIPGDATHDPIPYQIQASCIATCGQDVDPGGAFDFVDGEPDAPLTCGDQSGVVFGADVGVRQSSAQEDAGTSARLSWARTSGGNGLETNEDLDATVTVHSAACGSQNASCVELTELVATIPDQTVGSVSLQGTALLLTGTQTRPTLGAGGSFTFQPGDVLAAISTVANGIPLLFAEDNVAPAYGNISTNAGTLSLTGLQFDYTDTTVSAQLTVDFVGTFQWSPPVASIALRSAGRYCADDVEFEATSTDNEGHLLQHGWWIPGTVSATGSILATPLSNGEHVVILRTQDETGQIDSAAMRYQRQCS